MTRQMHKYIHQQQDSRRRDGEARGWLIQHKESEVVEFKKAERSFDFDDLGEYFSALSNEANLRGLDFA